MNSNAIIPNVYISLISYCTEIHKASLLPDVTDTCSCTRSAQDLDLITKLTDTWKKICYNEFIVNCSQNLLSVSLTEYSNLMREF